LRLPGIDDSEEWYHDGKGDLQLIDRTMIAVAGVALGLDVAHGKPDNGSCLPCKCSKSPKPRHSRSRLLCLDARKTILESPAEIQIRIIDNLWLDTKLELFNHSSKLPPDNQRSVKQKNQIGQPESQFTWSEPLEAGLNVIRLVSLRFRQDSVDFRSNFATVGAHIALSRLA